MSVLYKEYIMIMLAMALACYVMSIVWIWYTHSNNRWYKQRQSDWFFKEAFTVKDNASKAVAFQQAFGWAGENDYQIVMAVFDDLQEAGLI
jgi:hypothetical protein